MHPWSAIWAVATRPLRRPIGARGDVASVHAQVYARLDAGPNPAV